MVNRFTHPFARVAALVCCGWLSAAGVASAQNPGAYLKPLPTKEKELIELVRTAEPPVKAVACKQLAIHGGKDCVPDVAKLLSDEQLASWALIALEAIPDSSAGDALRKASETLKGQLLVGVIDSLGVRGETASVDVLKGKLKDSDAQVASAAAVALGRVGNGAAIDALRKALADSPPAVRSAVAEGLILCAEKLLVAKNGSAAADIYDAVRKADVPKQRILEATRGAILARDLKGIPLLVEQLKSSDKALRGIGLSTACELPGREVAEALAGLLAALQPDQAALLLYAMLDRKDPEVPKAVMEAAKTGPTVVRVAAISVIGSAGDPSTVGTLLEIVTAGDPQLSLAAKAALSDLPGDKVDAAIRASLAKADAKTLPMLIEIVGLRRIDASEALIKALDQKDPAVRNAALLALGETIGPKQLGVLINQVVSPRDEADAKVAQQALKAAAVRMPDAEETAKQLATALPAAPAKAQVAILSIIGAVGGKKALETIDQAMAGTNAELQDVGSALLGQWMTADASPVLLKLSKTGPKEYRIRVLRGYIRIAKQFKMPVAERAEMCQQALDAATRPEEQKLVLGILEVFPAIETLKLAVKASEIPGLKDDAVRSAMKIAGKLGGDVPGVRESLAQLGLEPLKVEIIKAEYGAGGSQKDVTPQLQQAAGIMPLLSLKKPNYNEAFGGDPAPNTPKQLKITYKINGKPGEAQFAENEVILLPMPQ